MPKDTTDGPSRHLVAKAVIGLITALGLVALGIYLANYDDGKYHPTKAETPMFSHLRHATDSETDHGRSTVAGELGRNDKSSPYPDVYVAKDDFRTVYTDHKMTILMRPGVKWLGGQLGHIVLVLQETSGQGTKQYQQDLKDFVFAPVVYDPFCYAYDMGSATRAACTSTQKQRQAVSAKQVKLKEISSKSISFGWNDLSLAGVPTGSRPRLSYDWTTPTGSTTALTWAQSREVTGDGSDTYFLPVTILKKSQKLTGGELGGRYVLLPLAKKVSGSTVPVMVHDPIFSLCQSNKALKTYLGPEPLAAHACN